jgi:16S rRNA (guanine1207-N2)-methyltransferase
VRGQASLAETLILDALRDVILDAVPGAPDDQAPHEVPSVLLIGMQSCTTVSAANDLAGAERVALLHLDRAAGAVHCGLGNPERFVGATPEPDERFSVVGINVEAAKSYRLLREVVGQTVGYVEPAGVVLVAGPRKGGAEVAARVLHDLFESVELVTYRQGQRVYRASGPRPDAEAAREAPPAEAAPESSPARAAGEVSPAEPGPVEVTALELRGQQLRMIEDDRIFAKGRLDPATRMLAEAFEIPPDADVLDLGSGSGVLGILAALLEPSCRAVLVDSDPLAVDVSRQNAELNGAANVSVYLSDVLADLPGQSFTTVLVNPPFHRGRAQDTSIAERFVTEASQALRPGGSIYLVCNRFLRYEPTLERLVGPVREVAGDRQFKVLLARKRTPPTNREAVQSTRPRQRPGRTAWPSRTQPPAARG